MYLWYNYTRIHWCWCVRWKTQVVAWFLCNFKNKEKKNHHIWNENDWETFFSIFKIILETGHIPDKFYGALVFPKYKVSGVAYYRNDVIERECMQR